MWQKWQGVVGGSFHVSDVWSLVFEFTVTSACVCDVTSFYVKKFCTTDRSGRAV
jgi:hypothetical protein